MELITTILICIFGLLLLRRIMTAPIRLIWKLALNLVCGFVALVLLNVLGGLVGIVLGINLLSAMAIGFLGLPGLGLLLILRLI